MNKDLEKQLKNEFGLEVLIMCDDGWFKLIHNLCSEINKVLEQYSIKNFKLKGQQKHGTLDLDFDSENSKDIRDEIEDLLIKYDYWSELVCEVCGKLGCLRENSNGWLKTLCDNCIKRDKYNDFKIIEEG